MELTSAINQSTNAIWEHMNVTKMHFVLIPTNHMAAFAMKDLMVMVFNAHWSICALQVHDWWNLVTPIRNEFV